MSPQDGAYVIMMQTLINFANLTILMHTYAQIVSFVHLLNAISCSWCKYLLQNLFETQLMYSMLALQTFNG